MDKFEAVVHRISRWFDRVAQAGLVIMMLLVVGNILLRVVWMPIPGTYEFAGFLGAVVISFALAYSRVVGFHPAIGVVMDRFPQRTQAIVDSITGILSIGYFVLAAWYCGKLATSIWHSGELSPSMQLPYHPLIYGIALGILLLALVIFVNLLKSLGGIIRK